MIDLLRLARLCCALLATAAGTPALSVSVSIAVRDADGAPLTGAIVSVEAPGIAPPPARGPYVIEQRDIQFQPRILIVPVGATVSFPNRDRVRHHVYSFSKTKKFDLKLYGREETRSIAFDKPGVVSLGCNIHDAMSGVVFVTATPFVAQTSAAGAVMLNGVPAGRSVMKVWHPSIRKPGNVMVQAVVVPPGGLVARLALAR